LEVMEVTSASSVITWCAVRPSNALQRLSTLSRL
jgi:hypothetical protein